MINETSSLHCSQCEKLANILVHGKYFCMKHYEIYAARLERIPSFEFVYQKSYQDKKPLIPESNIPNRKVLKEVKKEPRKLRLF